MRILTEREKKARAALTYASGSCVLLDRVRMAPPGRALELLPQHVQDDLKLLKSKDLNRIRPDLAVIGLV